MKLNLGCGQEFVEGWVNVDYSLGARVAQIPVIGRLARAVGWFRIAWDPRIVVHDLTKPLPWPDHSVEAVYSSHTLEHLRRDAGDRLIGECRRVLQPGGIARIVVPDLRRCVQAYLDGRVLADAFIESLLVLSDANQPLHKRILTGLFDDGHTHKCMYDHEALVTLMAKHGFAARKCGPFESAIPEIRDLETESRARGCVVVEGVKQVAPSAW